MFLVILFAFEDKYEVI